MNRCSSTSVAGTLQYGISAVDSDNMMSSKLRMLRHLVVESVATNHHLREIPYGN